MSEREDLRQIRTNVGDDVLGPSLVERLQKLLEERLLKLILGEIKPKKSSGKAD